MPAIESVQDFNSRFGFQTKVHLWVPIKNALEPTNIFLIYLLKLWTIFVDSMDDFVKIYQSFYYSFDAHLKIQNLIGL